MLRRALVRDLNLLNPSVLFFWAISGCLLVSPFQSRQFFVGSSCRVYLWTGRKQLAKYAVSPHDLKINNSPLTLSFITADVAGVGPQSGGEWRGSQHVPRCGSHTGGLPRHREGSGEIGGGQDWKVVILETHLCVTSPTEPAIIKF